MESSSLELASVAWRILVVFVLLYAGLYGLRRWMGGLTAGAAQRGRLRVVESLPVGPQRHLLVVEIEGRQFLIGSTPQTVTFLTELRGARPGTGEDASR
ncbi:MAG: flagellar biosynthetic protein FliO [Firmicutes bacterium ZCTH02-B6]|nr:MAG: flagellar biosynthetic protein FliO [Firmicutes bacterium ZCTH02-B6]